MFSSYSSKTSWDKTREIKFHVKDYDNKTNNISGVLIKKYIESVENGPFKHFPIKLYIFA